MQICFLTKKEKKRIGKYTAKLTFLWYDNFGKKKGLCIGMAGLPFQKKILTSQLHVKHPFAGQKTTTNRHAI